MFPKHNLGFRNVSFVERALQAQGLMCYQSLGSCAILDWTLQHRCSRVDCREKKVHLANSDTHNWQPNTHFCVLRCVPWGNHRGSLNSPL